MTQQTISQEMFKEWLAHPVTQLHQKRLALASADEIGQRKINTLVESAESVEALGMRIIAVANRAEGITSAYDHDPDLFYTWLMESANV